MPKQIVRKSMKTKTTPYDVAEQLRTPEEMAAYLDAWLEEAPDDASGIARALGDIARAKGMTQVAKDAVAEPGKSVPRTQRGSETELCNGAESGACLGGQASR